MLISSSSFFPSFFLFFFFYKIEDKGISFLKSFQWRYLRFYFYRRLLASSRPSYTYLMTLEWFRLIFYIVDISYPRLVKKRQVQLKKQKKESLFFNWEDTRLFRTIFLMILKRFSHAHYNNMSRTNLNSHEIFYLHNFYFISIHTSEISREVLWNKIREVL